MYQTFLKRFLTYTLMGLGILALITIVLDPFFHYHKPLKGLKGVLTEREYQCVGSIDHFEYDSLILGSSVTENFNNEWFDKGYGCKSLKAVRASGSAADIQYLLKRALERNSLAYVFYSLDNASLLAPREISFEETGGPMYLYNQNPFDDVKYLWNKDVLLERIPYLLMQSLFLEYDEGESFSWAEWKNFNEEDTVSRYTPFDEKKEETDRYELIEENLDIILKTIKENKNTEFIVFFPPYSLLWWDNAYRNGEILEQFYLLERCMEELIAYENVKVYYFQNEKEIIFNLNNYMDNVHFSKDVNQYMVESMLADRYRITEENYQMELEKMKAIVKEIEEREIKKYYSNL